MVLVLVLPPTYPYILMGLAANFLFCMALAPAVGLPARKAAFTGDHLKAFEGLHITTFGEGAKVDGMGQPDQGQGWYSKTLALGDWVRFNSAQRVMLNYIESFPFLIAFSLAAGIYYPAYAVIGVWTVLFGRVLYAIGYKKSPKLRIPGALIMMVCNLTMMVLSFFTMVKLLLKSD